MGAGEINPSARKTVSSLKRYPAYIYKIKDAKGFEYGEVQTNDSPHWVSGHQKLRLFYCGVYTGYIIIPFNHEFERIQKVYQV